MELQQILSQIESPFTNEKIKELIYQFVSMEMEYKKMYTSINNNNDLTDNPYSTECYKKLSKIEDIIVRENDKFWYYAERKGLIINQNMFNPEYRIYINAKGKDKADIVEQFINFQQENDGHFILKYSKEDGRKDEIVIWCTRDDLARNVNAIQHIILDKNVDEPPDLVGIYNDKIGIGEEYTKGVGTYSYTDLRIIIIRIAIEKYLLDHYSDIIQKCDGNEKEILTNLKDSFERSKEAAKRRFERHPNSEEQLSKYRVLENNIRNESFWLFYAEPPSKTEVELVKKVLNDNSCESINEMIQNYRAVANALEIGNNCVISIRSEHIIKDEDNSKVNPNEVRFSSRPRVQRTNDDLDEI